MKDRIFLDTNTLIYVHSITEPLKKQIINEIIENYNEIILSTQVINEFINVMYKKRKVALHELNFAINELENNFFIAQITRLKKPLKSVKNIITHILIAL